ncbi:DUF2306 domain-containing protein [Stenotrophomonas sp. ISL-67]|uniref:DUF2306 domain-containing protein n=1 Tax=Stenotrophomonas sp. ISL-67 TaxID=2819171 RepID=UPI001BE60029|nr:DUF2306 domain-containing protein [Stenotrophomonas sp. ISL-67]MBT2766153.1 DUF2306 domain-containing protein [Stenotrophomonas sp. ISL-67]
MSALPSRWYNVARTVFRAGCWLIVVVVSAEFLLAAYGKYGLLDSPAYGRFVDRHGWLWLHLAGGVVAIVAGPVQLLARWWWERPALHRQVGYVYFGGILTGSAAAAGLIATTPAPLSIKLGFAGTALAWLTTALLAMLAIHRGRVQRHRTWMLRNYAVTLAPVLFRLMLPVAIAAGLAPGGTLISCLLWASWLVPLAVLEAFRRRLPASTPSPYRWRTALRQHLPWWLINRGFAGKGKDCAAHGGAHSWYNIDGATSGCYHCRVVVRHDP